MVKDAIGVEEDTKVETGVDGAIGDMILVMETPRDSEK